MTDVTVKQVATGWPGRHPKPGRSCADKAPHLIAEWHPILNGKHSPYEISAGSDFKPWWQCKAGHEWRASVHTRVIGTGCEKCARARQGAAAREESLAAIRPDLAAQWHPSRNGTLTPWDIKPGSGKEIWWICENGHEWQAPAHRRTTNGAGCYQCTLIVKPGNSIAERRPEIVPEWDQDANGGVTPYEVNAGSNRRFGWKCLTCGHRWSATVQSRCGTGKAGCRRCFDRRFSEQRQVPKPGNSIAERRPDLAAEWDQDANGGVTPHDVSYASSKKRAWRCSQGHTWQATPAERVRGYGCSQCGLSRTSIEEIRLRSELIAAGLPIDVESTWVNIPGRRRRYHCDMVCPDWKLIIEFDSEWFHRSRQSITRDTTKTLALTNAGWTVIRVRDGLKPLFDNDIALPAQQTPLVRAKAVLRKAAELGFHATRYDDYLATDQPWGAAAASEALKRELKRSITTDFPEVAAQWHPTRNGLLTPDNVRPGTHDKYWWLCPQCGNAWEAEVKSRTYDKAGCEPCAKKKAGRTLSTPKPGRSCADKASHLLAEWHPDNELTLWQVRPGARRPMLWRCNACQHKWEAPVASRVRGAGCPPCGEKTVGLANRRPKPGRALAERYPKLADEWDQAANGDTTPADVSYGSNLIFSWKCRSCGHCWKAAPVSRTRTGRTHCDRWGGNRAGRGI